MKLREAEQIAQNTENHYVMYHNELYLVPDDGCNIMRHGCDFDEDGNYSPGYGSDIVENFGGVLNYLSCEAWKLSDEVLGMREYGTEQRKTGVIHPHFMFWELGDDPNDVLIMSNEDLWRYVASTEPDEATCEASMYREIVLNDEELARLK